MAVLAREDDLLLRGDGKDGRRRAEVHPDPALPRAAREFDLLLGDGGPGFTQRLGGENAGRRRHEDPGSRRGYATRLLIAVDGICRSGLRSSGRNSYYQPPGFPRSMPLRFWKKEKPEKGKPEAESEKPKAKPKEKPAVQPAPIEKAEKPEPVVKKPEEKAAAPAAPP